MISSTKCWEHDALEITTTWSCLMGMVLLGMAGAADAAPDSDARSGSPLEEEIEEEIIVTATKRPEGLGNVSTSITVVTGDQIRDGGNLSLPDVSRTVPAVTLSKGSTTDRLFVRGIGSGDNPSFEQSVGTFVDDVYHGRARTSQGSIFDIERIEILKGPQTTYFGNNAIAGALNVTAKEPGPTFDASVRALYNATFENYLVEGTVNQPLNDELWVRVAALTSGGDGWIEDFNARENAPETDNMAARGTILWKPNDDFSAKLKLQYSDESQLGGLPIVRRNCPPPPSFTPRPGFCTAALASGEPSGWFERSSSSGQKSELNSREAVATLSYGILGSTFTSVTAYTEYDYKLQTDLDTLPVTLFSVSAPEDYEQFSQELRFDARQGGPIEYLAGVYYQSSRLTVHNDFNLTLFSPIIVSVPAFAPLVPYLPFAQAIRFRSEDENISGFGALTWNISPDWRTTLALRYTRVEKDFDKNFFFGTAQGAYGPVTPLPQAVAALGAAFARIPGLGVPGENSLSRTDDRWSPSLSVEYDVGTETMVYARYDSGFKAGGFNGVDTSGDSSALAFSPEKVDAYEIGLKSGLSNGVTLYADLFRSEYTDLQLAGVVPSTSGAYVNRVQNAGGAISQGAELEIAWEINPQWSTSLSATALDAHYTQYPNATPTAEQTQVGLRSQDLAGRPILFGPDMAGRWILSWSRNVWSGLDLTITNQLYGSSSYFLGFSDDPYLKQRGYVREDLSVTLASPRGWEFSVIGKNLTDALIRTYGATLPSSLGTYVFITEPPRNVSVQFKYLF